MEAPQSDLVPLEPVPAAAGQAAAPPVPPPMPPKPERFLNRELSWLEFNASVLEEAEDPTVPLLERVKFLSIFSANLDEFFMVRIAGIKRQLDAGVEERGPDGLTPRQTYEALAKRLQELVARQHRVYGETVGPALSQEGVRILAAEDLSEAQRTFLEGYFRKSMLPVVTPLAIDPAHPFPHLANRALCLAVMLEPAAEMGELPIGELAFVHTPSSVLPRFIRLPAPEGQYQFVLIEEAMRIHLAQLFGGYRILGCYPVRVTRDSDLIIDEDKGEDLLKTIEEGVRARRLGEAVRLQYSAKLPKPVVDLLQRELLLEPEDLFPIDGFIAFSDLMQLYNDIQLPKLKDPALPPQRVPALDAAPSIFAAIRKGDALLHHPYQSFDYVVRFVREAAEDPHVLAIKMTLYRVGGSSPIVQALQRAAMNGKQVAVLLELKARFDEEANIQWARKLEQAGAHVIYGLVGLKTHAKACLVVRREEGGIRRYCHLSTGNYNARTAWVYCDLGVFSAREDVGEDVTHLFNAVTGYHLPPTFHHLEMAPVGLRRRLVELIRRERAHAEAGKGGRMVIKLNSLQDPEIIEELYAACRAGAEIDLIVRGICCLRPGVPGLSERIRVTSIIDRFLEHARIFYFRNASNPEYYLSSGDWMPRNLDRRIEVLFPVLDPALRAQVQEALDVQLADNVKARAVRPDGTRARKREGLEPVRSQVRLHQIACRMAQQPR